MHSKYSGRAVSLVVFLPPLFFPLVLTGQRAQDNVVPLKNWAAPLYWQPNKAEREAALKAVPQLQFSANSVSTDALTFVAITPCRLVDTRGAAAGFNGIAPFSGPSISAGGTLTIPVQSAAEATANTAPAPCGVIPSKVQAYSVNLTVVPVAGGSVGYVSLWPAGSPQPVVATVNDVQGLIVNMAAIVPAGTPSGGISVFNDGPATTDVVIDMNGYFAAPTDLKENTAIGLIALANNTTGFGNTASGEAALFANTTGSFNSADGAGALNDNTTGYQNTASGFVALNDNTTGSNNTASGFQGLGLNTTGTDNTAAGANALLQNATGSLNTASGSQALYNNATGNNNIAIGFAAAVSVSGGNSNNIHIGSGGAAGDSGVIKIGTPGTQTSFFAAGVRGVATGNNNAVPVVIDSNGQLGTVSSSRRFKEDIEDMGAAATN